MTFRSITARLRRIEKRVKPNWKPPDFQIAFVDRTIRVVSTLHGEAGWPVWRDVPPSTESSTASDIAEYTGQYFDLRGVRNDLAGRKQYSSFVRH